MSHRASTYPFTFTVRNIWSVLYTDDFCDSGCLTLQAASHCILFSLAIFQTVTYSDHCSQD